MKRTGARTNIETNMADDNNEGLPIESVVTDFENTFDHPESYLKPPTSLHKDTLIAIKQIFDFCKKDELSGKRSLASTCPLQELLVENFDDEQIWQEIELQNAPLLRGLKQEILDLKENAARISLLSGRSEELNHIQGLDGEETAVENSNGFVKRSSGSDTESDSIGGEFNHGENSHDQLDDDDDDDDDIDNDDDDDGNSEGEDADNDENDGGKVKFSSSANRRQRPLKKKSQVDDTFFKLSDMLDFLDKEDKKYERAREKNTQRKNNDDDDSEEEVEPVDYFTDMESDNAEDDEDEEWNKALGVTESLLGR